MNEQKRREALLAFWRRIFEAYDATRGHLSGEYREAAESWEALHGVKAPTFGAFTLWVAENYGSYSPAEIMELEITELDVARFRGWLREQTKEGTPAAKPTSPRLEAAIRALEAAGLFYGGRPVAKPWQLRALYSAMIGRGYFKSSGSREEAARFFTGELGAKVSARTLGGVFTDKERQKEERELLAVFLKYL